MRRYIRGTWTLAKGLHGLKTEILCQDKVPIADVHIGSLGSNVVDKANAARIVECVNACEGIESPAVIPEVIKILKETVSPSRGYTVRDCQRALEALGVKL